MVEVTVEACKRLVVTIMDRITTRMVFFRRHAIAIIRTFLVILLNFLVIQRNQTVTGLGVLVALMTE